MTKKTKIIIAIGAFVVVYYIYKKMKSSSKTSNKTSANFSNFATNNHYVVGGYNSSLNQTWIFQEGNTGQGYWTSGHVLSTSGAILPQGTRIVLQ